MSFIESIKSRAAANPKTIVLPEGQDPRVIDAARILAEEKIAKIVVLASDAEIESSANDLGANDSTEIIDIDKSKMRDQLARAFFERRAHKGLSVEDAEEAIGDRLYFAAMMLATGAADGMVAGSIASTGNVLRAAFQCVGTAPGIKTGSSSFAMELSQPTPAGEDVILFADCAVNPNPTPPELCDIAVATAKTYSSLIGSTPRVAFLSFSTKGSAKHELVDRMREAFELTQKRAEEDGLDIIVDGELQADSALVPAVARSKCPDSPIEGTANILIFPDLQSGNIAYKLTQRLASAGAYGPILQGLSKPINDLSRGCSVDDIVGVCALTACQAE